VIDSPCFPFQLSDFCPPKIFCPIIVYYRSFSIKNTFCYVSRVKKIDGLLFYYIRKDSVKKACVGFSMRIRISNFPLDLKSCFISGFADNS
jgi:hypothetical protein